MFIDYSVIDTEIIRYKIGKT